MNDEEKIERLSEIVEAAPVTELPSVPLDVKVSVVSTPSSIGAHIYDEDGNPVPEKPEHWSEP